MTHPYRNTAHNLLFNGGPLYHTQPPHWSRARRDVLNAAADVGAFLFWGFVALGGCLVFLLLSLLWLWPTAAWKWARGERPLSKLRQLWVGYFCAAQRLPLLLLCFTLSSSAAPKPEPLTYKLGGRRYVIAVPDSQLWSQSEVAQAVSGHASGKLFIDGKEVRQARVRGTSQDRTNRNFLVIVMRTGKRLSPEARYMVRPDPFASRPALPSPPLPVPKALSTRPIPKSSALVQAGPLVLRLRWDDVAGAVPGGWGAGPQIMPDGGTKFWTVYASQDGATWRPVAVTETNTVLIGVVWDHEFYRVHYRDEGAPAWRWP